MCVSDAVDLLLYLAVNERNAEIPRDSQHAEFSKVFVLKKSVT